MRPRSPVRGFNHNARHHGRVYHVQTEDSGVQKAHIYTHLFFGGTIIATKKSNYEADAVEETIKKLMQAQHKAVLKGLMHGDYDERIVAIFGALDAPEEEVGADAEISAEPVMATPLEIENTERIGQVSEEDVGMQSVAVEVTLHPTNPDLPALPPSVDLPPPSAAPAAAPPSVAATALPPVEAPRVSAPPPPPPRRIWAKRMGQTEQPFNTTGEFRMATEIADRAVRDGQPPPAPAAPSNEGRKNTSPIYEKNAPPPSTVRPAVTAPTSEGVVVARPPIVVGTGTPVVAPAGRSPAGVPSAGRPSMAADRQTAAIRPDAPAAPGGAPQPPPGSFRSIPPPARPPVAVQAPRPTAAPVPAQTRPPAPAAPPARPGPPQVPPAGASASPPAPAARPPVPGAPPPASREPGLDEVILDYLSEKKK